MVTVPVLGGPQVEPRPVDPGFQSSSGATLDAFGGQQALALQNAGRSLGALGDTLARAAVERQIEDNERELKNYDIKFSEARRKLLLGDPDNNIPGFFSLRGQAAIDGVKPVAEALRKAQQDLLNSTKNQRVRQMFSETSAADLETELGAISRHVAVERVEASKTVAEARMNEAIDMAIAYWNDPTRIADAENITRGEVLALARLDGIKDRAVVESKFQEAQTILWTGVIEASIQADPAAASALYEANKHKIDARKRPALEKMLQTTTLLARATEAADMISAQFPNDPKAQRLAAKSISDPTVRAGVLDMLRETLSDARGDSAEYRAWVGFYAAQGERAREAVDRKRAENAIGLADEIASRGKSFAEQLQAADRAAAGDPVLKAKIIDALEAREVARLRTYTEEDRTNAEKDRARRDTAGVREDAERARKEAAVKEAKRIADGGAPFSSQLEEAAAAAIGDEALEAEIVRNLEINKRATDTADKEALGKVRGQAYADIQGGMALVDWQRLHPKEFEQLSEESITIGNLRAIDIANAEGRMFATATDGHTLAGVRGMSTAEQAAIDPAQYRVRLTQSEFTDLTSVVVAAQTRLKATQENQTVYNTGEAVLRDYAPVALKWGQEDQSEDRRKQQQAAITAMSVFIAGFTEAGKLPTREELKAEAIRLMVPVVADPSGLFNKIKGVGAQVNQMTPVQKGALRIDIDDIPPVLMEKIDAALKKYGVAKTDDLAEELAGADLVGDTARILRLLGQ